MAPSITHGRTRRWPTGGPAGYGFKVDLLIVLRHDGGVEAGPTLPRVLHRIDLVDPTSGEHHLLHVLIEIAGNALVDQLGRGAPAKRDHRSPDHHRLDHRQTKRL